MDAERLVYMANQIVSFFKVYPEAEAIAAVETHIRQFWDPRMRKALLAHIEEGGSGLTPIAKAAADRIRAGAPAKA
ncbi:MAG: formate dehydrogenase subunit delta [Rhodospirillales bacterium]|nr:formate dehydrogenase subunit delta [Rhodospirillales bacterium]